MILQLLLRVFRKIWEIDVIQIILSQLKLFFRKTLHGLA